MSKALREFLFIVKDAAKEAPRFYFAPLVGLVRGTRAEYRRLYADREARWEQFQRDEQQRAAH